MRSPANTILVLFASLGLAACYSPMTQVAVEARELYRSGEFGMAQLESEGITFVAARVSFGHETLGAVLVQGLVRVICERLPLDRTVHPNLLAGLLNEADLAHDYAEMLEDYDDTHILGRKTLRAVSEAAGVRYVAVPILVNLREQTSTRFSVFGVRVGKTASAHARFQLQIWDAQTGHVSWEGLSDLTIASEMVRENPVRLEETVEVTWRSLLDQIPPGGVGSDTGSGVPHAGSVDRCRAALRS